MKLTDYGVDGNGQRVLGFHCPGCGHGHAYFVPRWQFNGSMETPTFTPSLLNFRDNAERRCHLHVTDGKIQFLNDCWHELKGQTVPLEDVI